MNNVEPMMDDFINHWIKKTYKLTDQEFEFILNNLSDIDDLNDFTCIFKTTPVSFSEKKRALKVKNKIISKYTL